MKLKESQEVIDLAAIHSLRAIYRLKKVERSNSVDRRKESPAEHSWSCLVLADFFMNKLSSKANYQFDRLKVYELLMYHDLVELETGDVCLSDELGRKGKPEKERAAMQKLRKELPNGDKLHKLFTEFEQGKTKEAQFARAIDAFDSQIHEMDYKKDWKGWTAEFLIKKKRHYFDPFPEMQKVFDELIDWLTKEGFFEQ